VAEAVWTRSARAQSNERARAAADFAGAKVTLAG
jgi:hypothetical protein